MMWSRTTAALLPMICLILAIAAPVPALANPDSDDAIDDPPSDVDAEGRAEYRDVETLHDLESESFRAVIIGAGVFDIGLLAPTVGIASDGKREQAKADAIQRDHRVGAELLTIPAVRERFEATSMFGLVVHDEPSVRSYLDFFDGRGKPILAKWIERMGRYRPLIEQVLDEEGLPRDLIYVAMIESGFSPYATSYASAVGVWQFIQKTAYDMGLRVDRWVDERRDPVKATRAAARYLSYLYNKFGSWPLALAAYNAGPGLMAKEVGRHNSNNYWHIQRNRGMYDQTRRYVPKVIAAGLVTKNADLFGLDHITEEPTQEWTQVTVPPSTRLSTIASAAGVDFNVIRFGNPSLIRKQTPPGEEWEVRIPADSLARFVQKFDRYVRDGGAEHVRHLVEFGESLDDIGRHHGVTPRVLRVANGLERRERVSFGEELLIPKTQLGSWKPRPSRKQTVVVSNAKLQIPGKKKWFYETQPGDTPEILGAGFGINPADIVVWNTLDPRAKLQPGMVVQLFLPEDREMTTLALANQQQVVAVAPGSSAAKRVTRKKTTSKARYHQVKSGESLWLIANKYKVSVDDLKKWNRKTVGRKNVLQPGMKLVVYRK